jgi:hypothetical protein
VNTAQLTAAANSVMASTINYPNMNPQTLCLAQQMNPGLVLTPQTLNLMTRAKTNPPMAAAAQELAANNSAQHLTAILNKLQMIQNKRMKGAHPSEREP